MKYHIGDCTNSFDENGDSFIPIFSDVTDFAQVEEEATEIPKWEFEKTIELEKAAGLPAIDKMSYWHHKDRDIHFAYDDEKDIHYFFN